MNHISNNKKFMTKEELKKDLLQAITMLQAGEEREEVIDHIIDIVEKNNQR